MKINKLIIVIIFIVIIISVGIFMLKNNKKVEIGNNDSNFHVLLISITAVIYFANVLYQIRFCFSIQTYVY